MNQSECLTDINKKYKKRNFSFPDKIPFIVEKA